MDRRTLLAGLAVALTLGLQAPLRQDPDVATRLLYVPWSIRFCYGQGIPPDGMYDITSLQKFTEVKLRPLVETLPIGSTPFDDKDIRLIADYGRGERFEVDRTGAMRWKGRTLLPNKEALEQIRQYLNVILPPPPRSIPSKAATQIGNDELGNARA